MLTVWKGQWNYEWSQFFLRDSRTSETLPSVQAFYRFFFVVVLQKGELRLLEKPKTQQISTPIRIRSRIFLTLHAVTSRYCFARFRKWKSSGLFTRGVRQQGGSYSWVFTAFSDKAKKSNFSKLFFAFISTSSPGFFLKKWENPGDEVAFIFLLNDDVGCFNQGSWMVSNKAINWSNISDLKSNHTEVTVRLSLIYACRCVETQGCRPVFQILILFRTKNVFFHTRFQTNIGRNYVIIT